MNPPSVNEIFLGRIADSLHELVIEMRIANRAKEQSYNTACKATNIEVRSPVSGEKVFFENHPPKDCKCPVCMGSIK